MSEKRIAITFVHGVEISDENFAKNAIALLRASFARQLGASDVDPAEALVIDPVYWAPVLDPYEARLLDRAFHPKAARYFRHLTALVTGINAGSQWALARFVGSLALRSVPGVARRLDYPALRWLVTTFLGDAIGYQVTPSDRDIYDAIHRRFAETLHRLAERAGPNAPLVVIAHSLGTVFSSNYLYDLQHDFQRDHHDGETPRQPLIPNVVARAIGPTPLERGETFTHFYTLGSPLALWTLRYKTPEFGVPIAVPAPFLSKHHPGLDGEWINFYAPDDMAAYPLRGLSDRYADAVSEDRAVSVGPFWVFWNPLTHAWYWNDATVIDAIAATLVRTWRRM